MLFGIHWLRLFVPVSLGVCPVAVRVFWVVSVCVSLSLSSPDTFGVNPIGAAMAQLGVSIINFPAAQFWSIAHAIGRHAVNSNTFSQLTHTHAFSLSLKSLTNMREIWDHAP